MGCPKRDGMGTLVSIGEFSRLAHLSVKALHHYHEVGILKPADIDARNGYRRYDVDQLPDAYVVRRLRDLAMPLDEVRVVLDAAGDQSRDQAIASHLKRMESELHQTQQVVASLRRLLAEPKAGLKMKHRLVPGTHAVTAQSVVGPDDVEAWSTDAFAALEVELTEVGVMPSGPSGSQFSAGYFEEDRGAVVAFVPINDAVPAAILSTPPIWIEGGAHAVALHQGSYIDLDRTYGALGSYVADHNIAEIGPITEFYLVGPESANDSGELRTEVCWPICPVEPTVRAGL